jgi:hypothetical protein
MQRFFRHHDRFHVYQVKSILDDAGIPCFVKNELVQGAIGEIPPMDSEPEIWLQDSEWQSKAQKILDWACAHCGQMNEFQFAICWKCQEPRVKDTGQS